MKSCCKKTSDKCKRQDGKIFKLPRKYTKKDCLTKKIKGFSMRSSCAPYKFCKNTQAGKKDGKEKNKKTFLFNPNNPKKSFDVYIDKNPKDTISIKYTTIDDVKNTIKKLEKLYKTKKYSHKRIWQVGMILKVRLGVMKKNLKLKNIKSRYNLANKYFLFLGKRTKLKDSERYKFTFNI